MTVALCAGCGRRCIPHCESPGCDLWICVKCRKFGNGRYWRPVGPFVSLGGQPD